MSVRAFFCFSFVFSIFYANILSKKYTVPLKGDREKFELSNFLSYGDLTNKGFPRKIQDTKGLRFA